MPREYEPVILNKIEIYTKQLEWNFLENNAKFFLQNFNHSWERFETFHKWWYSIKMNEQLAQCIL
jgi:hypothetical protein